MNRALETGTNTEKHTMTNIQQIREIRDLKHQQRNGRRRLFATRLGQGFCFWWGKRSLSSAASQTDDDFFFAKNSVFLQSCYGI